MNDWTARTLGGAGLVLLAAIALLASQVCSLSSAPQVAIDGSSTLFPVTQAIAEDFSQGQRVQVTVGISGTGGGFEKFCRGEIEVSAASRPINDAERAACAARGIDDIVQFDIAIDALTVLVSTRNTFVQCLTVDELADVFREGGAKRWNEIRPEWPDTAITVYHPGPDSGTFDYFSEVIVEAGATPGTHRTDGTSSEDDNLIAVGVGNDRYGIAYIGYAYYHEISKQARAVAIDSSNGCIAPSAETAAQGEYTPLSRRLYYYTRETTLRENDVVRGLFEYAYGHLDGIIEETGYISLPPDAVSEERTKLAAIVADGGDAAHLAPAATP